MAQQICPKCGSADIDIQMFAEETAKTTVTKTKSKYKEKGHGLFWWLFIGWWWWIVDLFLWIFLFIPRLILQLFKKKKVVGSSTSVSATKSTINYRSMCLCKKCGYHWDAAKVKPVEVAAPKPAGQISGAGRVKIAPQSEPEVHVITKEEASSFSGEKGMYDYEYSDCGIYRPDNLELPMPPVGAQITFENDPENEYDNEAIKAVWEGQTVGWLYRKGKREMIRDWIDRGDYYVAEVTENDPELKFWIGMDRS